MVYSLFGRLTPRSTTTMDDIVNLFNQFDITKYVLCYEEASKPHFHFCVWTTRSAENLRYQFKQKLDTQVYISGKDIEDKIRAIAYCFKDGNYVTKNIDILTIMAAKSVTFKKVSFDDELKEIQNDNSLSIEQITNKIIDLYIKYNRKIYRQHIRALIELIKVKRSETYRNNLIKNLIDDY